MVVRQIGRSLRMQASTRVGVPFVCRHLLGHAPKYQSGDSATPSVQRGTDWALFCDHYVGTKKWSKT